MVAAHTAGHTIIRQAFDGLLDLLYPPRCVACGAWGAWLCARCLTQLPPGGQSAGTLGYCTSILWVAAHTHPLRPAVHALKYDGVTALVEPLSELLASRWLRASAARATCTPVVAPVPLHPAREKERGYNQSVLLATATARRLGLPCAPGLLRRLRDTASQVGLNPRQRWLNVWGAFGVAQDLHGGAVLLVDDVMTTGATLEACGAALRAAGALHVWALTLTRAPGRFRRPPDPLLRTGERGRSADETAARYA